MIYGNPNFSPTAFQGTEQVSGIPVYHKQLPITLGGIVGELPDGYTYAPFGRVVSSFPATPRHFVLGNPAGSVPRGMLIADPVIMHLDPAMNKGYFEGRACTIAVFGVIQVNEYDLTQNVPADGRKIFFRKDNGLLAFSTALPSADYGTVYGYIIEKFDPNGATLFLNGTTGFTDAAAVVETIPTITLGAITISNATATSLEFTVAKSTPVAEIHYIVDQTSGTLATINDPLYQDGGLLVPTGATGAWYVHITAFRQGYLQASAQATVTV